MKKQFVISLFVYESDTKRQITVVFHTFDFMLRSKIGKLKMGQGPKLILIFYSSDLFGREATDFSVCCT